MPRLKHGPEPALSGLEAFIFFRLPDEVDLLHSLVPEMLSSLGCTYGPALSDRAAAPRSLDERLRDLDFTSPSSQLTLIQCLLAWLGKRKKLVYSALNTSINVLLVSFFALDIHTGDFVRWCC